MSVSMGPPKIVFGAFQFDRKGPESQKRLLELCEEAGIREIDSGIIYENCEPILGSLQVAQRFRLHGKSAPSQNSRDQILASAGKSAHDLGLGRQPGGGGAATDDGTGRPGTARFDGFYLHAPDPVTPMSETYDAIQSLYEAGIFTRFGLSNFQPADVERFYQYGKEKGYVLPTLYQGLYNALSRRCETELVPTLRRLGISLYCYSPLGAGFFMTDADTIREGREGRFNAADIDGLVYQTLYHQPAYMAALTAWADLATRCGLAKAELAWRWITFHSILEVARGDAIITSAETPDQLQQLLQWRAKGPLGPAVADEIDAIWSSCAQEAPLDCVNGWFEAVEQGRVVPPDYMKY